MWIGASKKLTAGTRVLTAGIRNSSNDANSVVTLAKFDISRKRFDKKRKIETL